MRRAALETMATGAAGHGGRTTSPRLRASVAFFGTLLGVLLLPGCALNPVTGRPDFVLVSNEKEIEIGNRAAAEVEAESGVYDRHDLEAYVQAVGRRLAARSPRQDVSYTFHVLDAPEPNAFALPGGHVYVTRGLLVLVDSEDELACVLGHEIGHVAARHSVRQLSAQAPLGLVTGITSGVVGLASPALGDLVGGVGSLASGLVMAPYSRDQEREADRLGQQLAAESGWDPAAMADFLHTMERDEKLQSAKRRRFDFLSTHPTTPERVANTAAYARELRRADEPPLSATRQAFLEHLAGLPTDVNVANGFFSGDAFVHPDFGLHLEFPAGWQQRNTPSSAIAAAPDGAAALILSLAAEGDDPMAGARQMQQEVGNGLVAQTERLTIGSLPAAHTAFRARGERGDLGLDVTWIAYGGRVFQLAGVTAAQNFPTFQKPFTTTRDSFRPLTPAERAAVRENRLKLVAPHAGESADAFLARTGAAWKAAMLAVANDLPDGAPLPAERLKVAVPEKYE